MLHCVARVCVQVAVTLTDEGGSVTSASSTEQAVAGSSTMLWQLGAWSACSADCLQVRGLRSRARGGKDI